MRRAGTPALTASSSGIAMAGITTLHTRIMARRAPGQAP